MSDTGNTSRAASPAPVGEQGFNGAPPPNELQVAAVGDTNGGMPPEGFVRDHTGQLWRVAEELEDPQETPARLPPPTCQEVDRRPTLHGQHPGLKGPLPMLADINVQEQEDFLERIAGLLQRPQVQEKKWIHQGYKDGYDFNVKIIQKLNSISRYVGTADLNLKTAIEDLSGMLKDRNDILSTGDEHPDLFQFLRTQERSEEIRGRNPALAAFLDFKAKETQTRQRTGGAQLFRQRGAGQPTVPYLQARNGFTAPRGLPAPRTNGYQPHLGRTDTFRQEPLVRRRPNFEQRPSFGYTGPAKRARRDEDPQVCHRCLQPDTSRRSARLPDTRETKGLLVSGAASRVPGALRSSVLISPLSVATENSVRKRRLPSGESSLPSAPPSRRTNAGPNAPAQQGSTDSAKQTSGPLAVSAPKWKLLEKAAEIARRRGGSGLARILESCVERSRAKATIGGYRTHLNRFMAWWREGPWSGLPEKEARKLFVATLIEAKKYKSVPGAVASLNYFRGPLEGQDAEALQALLDTAVREAPSTRATRKVTEEELQKIVKCGGSAEMWTQRRTAAICVLLFRGLLRIGEGLELQSRDLVQEWNRWKVLLRKSKTDQSKLGFSLILTTGSPEENTLIGELRRGKGPTDPICTKAGGGRLTPDLFARNLKQLLALAKVSELITSHSFRGGGASSLVEKGIPIEKVMLMGRWRSIEAFRRYVSPEALA